MIAAGKDVSTRLFLVRHGETEWNKLQLLQGQTNIGLNEEGILQAKHLAARLAKEKPSYIFTSDLCRAKKTAEIIACRTKSRVITTPNLREMNYGLWEGLNWNKIKDLFPTFLDSWQRDPLNVRIPEGESFTDMINRVERTIWEIVQTCPASTVVVVTHSGPIKGLVCKVLGIDLNERWRFTIDNTSLTEIKFGPRGPVVLRLNDTCHLDHIEVNPESE